MFTRLCAFVIAAALGAPASADAAAPAPPIFVAGQLIRERALDDGRAHVLVPVRGIFEALGAHVDYTPPRIVVVRKGESVVAGLVVGRYFAVVANRRRQLTAAPVRIGGRVYVPLRSVAEIAGATVRYARRPRLIDIRLPNNELRVADAAPPAPPIPPDPAVPPWAYALVGTLVAGFVVEAARQMRGRRPARGAFGRQAVPSRMGALQLPYPVDAGDQHRIGEVAK